MNIFGSPPYGHISIANGAGMGGGRGQAGEGKGSMHVGEGEGARKLCAREGNLGVRSMHFGKGMGALGAFVLGEREGIWVVCILGRGTEPGILHIKG
jgi:hypothetical protein